MDIGFKNKIVLHSFREVKCHQSYTSGICYQVYLQGSNKYFLFNPDIEYFVLKTDREKGRRPYFIIFVFWSALIVTG